MIGMMSKTVIPCLTEYIETILNEDVNKYFDKQLMEEVERLDRALEKGHSLDSERRFEKHKSLYNYNPASCTKLSSFPKKYQNLAEEETEAECPVCKEQFIVSNTEQYFLALDQLEEIPAQLFEELPAVPLPDQPTTPPIYPAAAAPRRRPSSHPGYRA